MINCLQSLGRCGKPSGRQPKRNNTKGDEVNNNPDSEISVLEWIKGYDNLFDMTANIHGNSSSTTSQGSRPSVSGDKKRAAADDDEDGPRKNSTKRRKNQTYTHRQKDDTDTANGRKNAATFEMAEWNPDDFFAFLQSAEKDMEDFMIPKDHESFDDFKENMEVTMRTVAMTTEQTLDDLLHARFNTLTQVLRLARALKKVYFGLKSLIDVELPPSIGTDNKVDLLYLAEKENFEHPSLIPWENKGSWNFPGGRLTSEDEDFARFGRDVKLHELVLDNEVQSLADTKHVTKKDTKQIRRRTIKNADEGVDTDEVKSAPAVKSNNRKPAAKVVATSAKTSHGQHTENGTYKMKETEFPVRQLVAYMISLNAKYGILSTGYRLDFVKLEVVNRGKDNEQLIAYIAGPLWSVGQLNTRKIRDTTVRDDHYYNQIHTYGRNNVSSILDSRSWSTNIGPYPFMEGLLRFLFAASGLAQQTSDGPQQDNNQSTTAVPVVGGDANATDQATTGKGFPRSYMPDSEMPGWAGQYQKNGQKRQNENNDGYIELCNSVRGQFGFEDDDEKKKYIMDMKKNFGLDWSDVDELSTDEDKLSTGGLTKFGPLTLSELKSGRNTESIGFGRIGQALSTTLDAGNIRIAYKILRQSEWKTKEFDQRVLELKREMEIYTKLQSLQGTCIPRFLYAGSVVDASKWLIPEKGEMIAFVTTYEGRSLSWYDDDFSRLPESFPNEHFDEFVEKSKESLKAIHECGVLHRDLELRNIVYDDESNKIKFVDFGNAENFSVDDESEDDLFTSECEKEIETLVALLSVFQPQPEQDESVVDSSETETAVNAESETNAAAEHVESQTDETPLIDRPESAPPRI